MPKTVTIKITVPDEVSETEINDWVEGIGDELKDDAVSGSRWIITGHSTAAATKGESATFKDDQENDDDDC